MHFEDSDPCLCSVENFIRFFAFLTTLKIVFTQKLSICRLNELMNELPLFYKTIGIVSSLVYPFSRERNYRLS